MDLSLCILIYPIKEKIPPQASARPADQVFRIKIIEATKEQIHVNR